ncbi:hypothetical protein TRFO_21782 [Tritrichomonas foetus]|uniref:Uncharacterized protein n=1 Tax=Tritrichomonas foetus TaxID=1144522 RepID=A0A1J4KJ09_9EUKA|nr:hypothetical protein TRFO_21782 [Tritrichomonas foetus]|eukprot:OHT09309.1 hypothetical protein TRFO_21782 [Tritrichomonas foetus]
MFDNFYIPEGQSTAYGHMRIQLPHQYGHDPEFIHPMHDFPDSDELIIQNNIISCENDRFLEDLEGESQADKNKAIQLFLNAFLRCFWQPLYQYYLANPNLLHRYPQNVTLSGRHQIFQTWLSVICNARYKVANQ